VVDVKLSYMFVGRFSFLVEWSDMVHGVIDVVLVSSGKLNSMVDCVVVMDCMMYSLAESDKRRKSRLNM
jgi:hypothetical protein